jgi:riboflavin biosynthesis pyrimidine reductase
VSDARSAGIDELFPRPAADLSDADLVGLYAPADRAVPRLRANFIASADGSATASGLSGDLGGPADKRVFDLQRRLADVIVVAAGTIRSEGYGAMRLEADSEAWRVSAGLAPQPAFGIVSRSLDLDPASDVFAKAPVRPLVFTADSAPADRRAALAEVADVVSCGSDTVDPHRLVAELVDRGLPQQHCEGGPSLLGSLIEADVLDALSLTLGPTLEGGQGGRITHRSAESAPIDLRALALDHVLNASGMLLLHYSRVR